ncbi:SCP-like extracellular [Altererythrobacter aurantiacus]|uniref:SCP-like extracellular n=1 Tax=Parapontixanthobacter aurantiacus TaxID=1463599 RepID=A0A844ZFI6_9SPHN|nr:CAP domain-containing protein [Parapontixanthobacter aurantiacus]MXO85730.1 SCP-like extracellular [Parapontixanthobacter aurantiacus]
MQRFRASERKTGKAASIRKLASAAALLLSAPILLSAQGIHTNFDERVLSSHNRERAELGLDPLVWNPRLARAAEKWSSHLAATGRFEHSPDEPGQPLHGENLWAGTRGYYQPEAMVGLWLKEKKYFKPGTFPHSSTTGDVSDVSHYTQIVWDETLEIGCALSRGAAEDVLVCRYARPGNVYGKELDFEASAEEVDPAEVKMKPFEAIFRWLRIM